MIQDLPTPYRSHTRGSDLVTGLRDESNLMALVHRARLVLTLRKSLSTFLDPHILEEKAHQIVQSPRANDTVLILQHCVRKQISKIHSSQKR